MSFDPSLCRGDPMLTAVYMIGQRHEDFASDLFLSVNAARVSFPLLFPLISRQGALGNNQHPQNMDDIEF